MSAREDRLATLVDSLDGIPLAAQERAALENAADRLDVDSVDGLASLLGRLAEQPPVPADQLAKFEASLTNQRDRAIERRDMFGHPRDVGEVDGFRASLAALSIWSDGKFGQDLAEQPGAQGGDVL